MPQSTRMLRRTVVGVVVTLVCSCLLSTVSTAPAAAVTEVTGGRPGHTTVYTPMLTIRDNQVYLGPGLIMSYKSFATNGLTVGRSPQRGRRPKPQTVSAQYNLQSWDGAAWVPYQSSEPYTFQMGRWTRQVTFPAWSVQPANQYTMPATYRLAVAVAWANRRGRTIGTKVIFHNLPSEVQCATVHQRCTNEGVSLIV